MKGLLQIVRLQQPFLLSFAEILFFQIEFTELTGGVESAVSGVPACDRFSVAGSDKVAMKGLASEAAIYCL